MLLSEGHTDARRYPIAVVWSEARIVRQRLNNETRLNAVIQQTVISSILSKKGGKALKELLEKLDDGY